MRWVRNLVHFWQIHAALATAKMLPTRSWIYSSKFPPHKGVPQVKAKDTGVRKLAAPVLADHARSDKASKG